MKGSEKKSKEIKEPTLGEILAVMNERFTLVENKIDQVENKTDQVDLRSRTMNDRMDGIDTRLGDLQRGQTKLHNQIVDIQDDVTSVLHASDKDALTIIDHERRIVRLEKVRT